MGSKGEEHYDEAMVIRRGGICDGCLKYVEDTPRSSLAKVSNVRVITNGEDKSNAMGALRYEQR